MKLLKKIKLSMILLGLAVAPSLKAAPVFAPNPAVFNVSGDSDVINTGTTILAYDVSGITGPAGTVNGVTFSGATTLGAGLPTFTLNFSFSNSQTYGATISPEYAAVLGNDFSSIGGGSIVVSGLTAGTKYALQIWSPNDQHYGDNLTEVLTDGSATGNVKYGFFTDNKGVAFITDTFTANAGGTETISFTGSFVVGVSALNLRELQAAPEPSTVAMLLGGGLLLTVMTIYRRKKGLI